MGFPRTGTALVTGASSGIGVEFARLLAAAGFDLALVARREERLRELAGELGRQHGVEVTVLPCDLTDAAARERLATGLRVDVLVNDAGFATGGPFHESDRDQELRQVRLLCEAPVDLMRRFLPDMVQRRSGAVINVASTAGMQPLPNSAGYAAAKAHILSLSESVHAEVRRHGVHVTALCPPPVHTELFDKEDHPVERVPRIAWLQPDEAARAGLDGARRNKRVVVPGALTRVSSPVLRFAPRAIQLRLTERAFPAVSGAAVVIGSGPNGLAAAIALAEAGREVTVLEAAEHAGGAVATEELTLPGFRHDTFSSVYPATVASPVFSRMPLERHGLRWVHPRRCYAHPLPDGRAAALSIDMEETAASLDAIRPGDGAAWRGFAGPYLEHFGAWRATLLAGFPPIAGPARLVAAHRLTGTLDFARLLLSPAEALAHRLFGGEGNRAWLYGSAMHGDVPPSGAGSAIAATHLNLMGHAVGWPSPEGGAARLAEALVGHLRSLGGTVRTGAPVTKVQAQRGRVAGVEVAGAEHVAASIVVADVGAAALVRLADLGGRYARELRAFRPGPATLKLDWALSGPVPWTAPEAREAGTVHVGGGEREVLEALSPTGSGLHERPFLLVGQQTVADPSRAPEGKHTAWAYTHGPHDADWTGHAERVEAQVERFAPGFKELILGRHELGPGDLEQRDANLVGGDVGAGSYTLDQVVFRPLPSLNPYRTPVRGLFLGSASAFPGGAVHGVPGHAAARAALREARVRRL